MMTVETWNDVVNLLPVFSMRIGVALVCGILLGIERERKDKPAGLRTIILITLGSALFMIVGNLIPFAYDWPGLSRIDPSRVASNVVTGIGFLGAGSIIQSRGSVQGLTTAAVIWVAAGIGMCAGLGFMVMAGGVTGIVLIALVMMDPIRSRLSRFGHQYDVSVVAPNDSLALDRILYVLEGHDVKRSEVEVGHHGDDELRIRFTYAGYGGAALRMLEALARVEGVHGTKLDEPSQI